MVQPFQCARRASSKYSSRTSADVGTSPSLHVARSTRTLSVGRSVRSNELSAFSAYGGPALGRLCRPLAGRSPRPWFRMAPSSLAVPQAPSAGSALASRRRRSCSSSRSFASQAGVLVLSPILSDVADDFGVSIAAAGQLRILAAPLAVVAALAAGRRSSRFSPRALLGAGSALLAVGSVASAAAPSFALLALAQVPMWVGISTILTAGVAASAAWSEPERRTRVVAHAFAGPPTAWIVGMPVIGLVAEVHWRLAFLALPLPAALLAVLAVAGRPRDVPIGAAVDVALACFGVPTHGAGPSASCSRTRRGPGRSCSAARSSRRSTACRRPRPASRSRPSRSPTSSATGGPAAAAGARPPGDARLQRRRGGRCRADLGVSRPRSRSRSSCSRLGGRWSRREPWRAPSTGSRSRATWDARSARSGRSRRSSDT